jgi:hypothetical protein
VDLLWVKYFDFNRNDFISITKRYIQVLYTLCTYINENITRTSDEINENERIRLYSNISLLHNKYMDYYKHMTFYFLEGHVFTQDKHDFWVLKAHIVLIEIKKIFRDFRK